MIHTSYIRGVQMAVAILAYFFLSMAVAQMAYDSEQSPIERGCQICTDNCEQWDLPEGKRACRIEFSSAHTPSYSQPKCPRNSSYSMRTERCECFQGFIASSPNASKCVPKTSGSDRCEEKYGAHARYAPRAGACYCRSGYEMKIDGKGARCERSESSEPKFVPTRSEWDSGIWRWQLQTFLQRQQPMARIKWHITDAQQRRRVHGYRVKVLQEGGEDPVASVSTSKWRRFFSFAFSSEHRYTVVITAVNRHGKEIFQTSYILPPQ